MSHILLNDFIQESLTLLDDAMDQVGDDGSSPAGVNTIFRSLHTIKGTSAMLDLVPLSRFIHRFEDFIRDRQDKGRGLSAKDSQAVMNGFNLLQDAINRAAESSLPDSPPFHDFLRSLDELLISKITLDRIERLLEDLKEQLGDRCYSYSKPQLAQAAEALEECLSLEKKTADQTIFSFAVDDLAEVTLHGRDVTEIVKRQLQALEKVAADGKQAFTRLNMQRLQDELALLKKQLSQGGNLLDWDIVDDLCDISPEVVKEAFTRLWAEGISTEAGITMRHPQATGAASETGEETGDAKTPTTPEKRKTGSQEEYLRISGKVLQEFAGMIGDLVANRNSLENLIQEMGRYMPTRFRRHLDDAFGDLDRHVNTLERQADSLNNRRLRDIFQRLPGLVSQLTGELDKEISLEISGGEIEVPRKLIRVLHDPLLHLIRNTLDHGIETREQREAVGKPVAGNLRISAVRDEEWLRLMIRDDGQGLNPEAIHKKAVERGLLTDEDTVDEQRACQLILTPGFSTAKKITSVSGRGVGMDVVRSGVEESGGTLKLCSETGQGLTCELTVPLGSGNRTRSILLVEAGSQVYGVEYRCLVEVLDATNIEVHTFKENSFFNYRGVLLPYLPLIELLGKEEAASTDATRRLLIVEDEQNRRQAFGISGVRHKIKVVVTPFRHQFLANHTLFSGTAVVGTGEPCLVLNFRDLGEI